MINWLRKITIPCCCGQCVGVGRHCILLSIWQCRIAALTSFLHCICECCENDRSHCIFFAPLTWQYILESRRVNPECFRSASRQLQLDSLSRGSLKHPAYHVVLPKHAAREEATRSRSTPYRARDREDAKPHFDSDVRWSRCKRIWSP